MRTFLAVVFLAALAPSCGQREIALGDHVAVGAVVPDLAWGGVDESGEHATIRLRDYAGGGTLIVRVQGGFWCGTCNWQAAHTGEALATGARVLDLVIGDRENAPATARDAFDWRASLDVKDHVAVAADPTFAFRSILDGALPLVVTIDTSTMTIVRAESNPAPDGALVDGMFNRREWDMIRAVRTPEVFASGDPSEIELGRALFEDTELSPAHVGCVTCHDPRRAFADDRPVAIGAARGDRHTPRIALAALSPSQFWDGRARTLEEQAKGPIENAAEMGSSPAFVAARVASAHRSAFDSIFPSAQGDDEILADVAKAIATYERSLRVKPNALDAYAAGDFAALSFPEKQGLAAFARQGCMQCHWGPRLTDDAFHVTRTPTGRADGAPDVGRADHLGAFKTPSLRGVGHAKFFAHGGVIDSLDAMVESYGDGDANDARSVGVREPWIPRFGETTRWSIVKLARTL
ncbi:MAG TPA: cytochrome c peroxidase [Polyangiaceae bacterium]|nr:cytochrome c peroxidase [Polyangiaceae bacterium]